MMTFQKMHDGEIATSVDLVARLVAGQFPQWAGRPLRPVPSSGTDNALYRLGDDLLVRLPRIDWAVGQAEKERRWLPRLAPHLPLQIPVQLALGEPAEGFPWPWSIYRWLEGENATLDRLADPLQAAADMARFIAALQRIDPAGGPPAFEHRLRGVPLELRDRQTRRAIAAMAGMIDEAAALAVWEAALAAPVWERPPVWFHGDLLPGNVLVHEGRLRAVIDFSGLGVGDPACDLMIAWGLFAGESRAHFREALAVDEATWQRGRGQALSQAVIFVPYYRETNPLGVAYARRMIDEVLADFMIGG